MESVLNSLLPRLVKDGVFGEGEFESITPDNDAECGFQYASEVAMVNVNVRKGSKDVESYPVVVKVQLEDEKLRKLRDTAGQFHNEITMYREVLPFLDNSGSQGYAKYYFGHASGEGNLDEDVLVVQNLKYLGYRGGPKDVFLDFDHLALAMKKIGELHAWSYSAKARDENKFDELKNKLRIIETKPDGKTDDMKLNYLCMKRGVMNALQGGEKDQVLLRFHELVEPVREVLRFLWAPTQPLGAIIHGDYCKNNVVYKYDPSGKPVDLAFFDLQRSKYSSTTVDLSFYLYMHTSAETRRKHWDELLDIYWKSVEDNVTREVVLPTREEFLDDFATKAVYGYFPASFYLPHMMFHDPSKKLPDLTDLSDEEILDQVFHIEKGLELISDIVKHMSDRGYIQKFVECLNDTIKKY